jgi:hypothetical protein
MKVLNILAVDVRPYCSHKPKPNSSRSADEMPTSIRNEPDNATKGLISQRLGRARVRDKGSKGKSLACLTNGVILH